MLGPRPRPFVNLHVHSEYSFLDGLAKIQALVGKAIEDGAPALALTDHGNLSGSIEFSLAVAKANAANPEAHPAKSPDGKECEDKACQKAQAEGREHASDSAAELRPIMGIETYVAYGSRFERAGDAAEASTQGEKIAESTAQSDQDGIEAALTAADETLGKANKSRSGHLVLLAKNDIGWHNLVALSSAASLEGFYYVPRIDFELLEKHHEGLIALSACIGGHLGKLIMKGDYAAADELVRRYRELFGEDYYLEIQDHLDGSPEQAKINRYALDAGVRLGVQVVATNDSHYVRRAEAKVEDLLLAIGTGSQVSDSNRGLKFDTPEFYLKAGWEMEDAFTAAENTDLAKTVELIEKGPALRTQLTEQLNAAGEGPDADALRNELAALEARLAVAESELPGLEERLTTARERISSILDASIEIAAKCESITIFTPRLHFPHFPIPSEFFDESIADEEERRQAAANAYFAHRVRERVPTRWPGEIYTKDHRDQVEYEIQAIQELGFAEYFLITEDITDYARGQGIPVGPGRGSAPGSVVSYVLGITNVDPFKYRLTTGGIGFTRFLNPIVVYWIEPAVFSSNPPTMPDETPGREEMEAYVLGALKARVAEAEAEGGLTADRKKLLQEEWRFLKQHDLLAPYWLYLDLDITGDKNEVRSAIAYFLGISDVNPGRKRLPDDSYTTALKPLYHFQHARQGMPDIDLDFPPGPDGREKVMSYVRDKYGHDRVCQVATFGVMKSRSAIKDSGRAMGLSYDEQDALAGLIPDKFAPDDEEEEAPAVSIKLMMTSKDPGIIADSQPLRDACRDPRIRNVIWYAAQLEGTKRQVGTHPCALIITPKPYIEYVPVMRTSHGEAQAQYDGKTLADDIGLLKEDFLGLKNLTVIAETWRLLRERSPERGGPIELDENSIPDDDPAAMALMRRAQTLGLFQFGTSFAQGILRQIKPKNVFDLMVATALGRPGPMEQIPVYVEGAKRGHGVYPDPVFERYAKPILEDTYGVLVYQEQVMLLAINMAGFSLPESDGLRKACAKKDEAKMAYYRERFVSGSTKAGIPERIVSDYWDKKIAPFARYAFNRSHSTAYGLLGYWQGYLKANHTLEFMTALMTIDQKEKGKVKGAPPLIVEEMADARKLGLEVLSIDINRSGSRCLIEGEKSIRLPFAMIKGLGAGPAAAIEQERSANGPYSSLEELIERMEGARVADPETGKMKPNPVNKTVIMNLIKVGAFDELDERGSLLSRYEALKATTSKKKQAEIDLSATAGYVKPEFSPKSHLEWEKELVGAYISGHPAFGIPAEILEQTNCQVADVLANERMRDDQDRVLAGVLINPRHVQYRNGNGSMINGKLSDGHDECEFVIFDRADNFAELTGRLEEVANEAVLLKGSFSRRKDRSGKPGNPQFVVSGWQVVPLPRLQDAVAASVRAADPSADESVYDTARAGEVSDAEFDAFFGQEVAPTPAPDPWAAYEGRGQ